TAVLLEGGEDRYAAVAQIRQAQSPTRELRLLPRRAIVRACPAVATPTPSVGPAGCELSRQHAGGTVQPLDAPAKRCKSGLATGSVATGGWTASSSSRTRKSTAAGVSRWSRPCGEMATPTVPASCASCCTVAWGALSQPTITVWANWAPVSLEARRTQ